MKKKLTAALLTASALLSLSACGTNSASTSEATNYTVVATTFPVYQMAQQVLGDAEGIELKLAITQQINCLHDYTLTVDNMRVLETADVVLINGAGLEDFMDDALESLDAPIIDASAGIDLLPYTGHEHHDFDDDEEDEDDHFDPHIWMDPSRAAQMTQNIAAGLSETQSVVPGAVLTENAEAYAAELTALAEKWAAQYETMDSSERNLITFHDGFAYLADAFDLTILKSIEEESGSEASAKDLAEIVSLVRSYDLPMIFVENNGSDSSAKAIARETGVAIGSLSMLMSDGGQSYEEAIEGNLATIYDGLHKGETERA